ncbi:MAG: tetraacyldisaccharide 4'-kinase [Paludibacteraceae bacterium]|nr:tetraacyldisaccharide 4'-kinase [Paludibacteraceae bacterium]
MKTEKPLILRLLLWPFSAIYWLVVTIRNLCFDAGILPSKKFDVPIISVGNITVGGTGKTPFTEYLIKILKTDHRVGVLSRGYKRKTSGYQLLTKDSKPLEVGDEPYQVKNKFPDIMVAVDANRCRGVENMLQESYNKPDLIILDDAYQHRYVTPDLSILLVDYNRMITEDHLLPMGELREPIGSKDRADFIVITKCPADLPSIQYRIIRKNLGVYPYQSLYFTTLQYGDLVPLYPKNVNCALTKSRLENKYTAVVVSGIASPLPFEEYVRTYMKDIITLNYSDHHNFSKTDFQKIESVFRDVKEKNKLIITTEKDAVRMMNHPDFPDSLKKYIYYIPLYIAFLNESGEDFDKKVWSYLEKNRCFSQMISSKG